MVNFEDFISYLKFEKRASEHTIVAYQNDLNQFFDFSAAEKVNEVSYHDVRAWIVHLMENDITARSVNRKLSTLRKYFKFLMTQDEISHNPMTKITGPRSGKRLPTYVPQKDMVALDEIFKNEPKSWENLRAYVIIMLFYETGIRLSELINLRVDGVSQDQIKVLGKRNKERLIPLRSGMYELLERYNDRLKEEHGIERRVYFLTKKNGSKLYEKLVYRIVNNYLSKATGIEKRSPHVLRHTFATHMLNNGADLNALKEILGHANLSATQVYTHNSLSQLKNIYKTAHPRGDV